MNPPTVPNPMNTLLETPVGTLESLGAVVSGPAAEDVAVPVTTGMLEPEVVDAPRVVESWLEVAGRDVGVFAGALVVVGCCVGLGSVVV